MQTRRAVLLRDPLCVECLAHNYTTEAVEVDHIKPLAKGGTDALDNLQGLCKTCHDDKTVREKGHRRKPRIGADGWPV